MGACQINFNAIMISWLLLNIIIIFMAIWFASLYFKDRDKRKLMFSMAFIVCSLSFLMVAFGINDETYGLLTSNIYQWTTLPIMIALLIAANENLYKIKGFDLLFKLFLASILISILMIFAPFNTGMIFTIPRMIIATEIIVVSCYAYLKRREFSSLMFLFSLVCFTIGRFSLGENNEYLSIFSFFTAHMLLGLIFVYTSTTKDKQGVGSYFSLQSKLHTLEKKNKRATQKLLKNLSEALEQRKRTESALRKSEEKYRDLFENANDLIQSVDKDGKFLYVNRKWLEVMGYTNGEVKKINLMDIIHKEQIPHCQQLFKRVSLGESFENIDTVFVSKEGREIIVEGAVNAKFENGEFQATRAIFHDVTERKLAEKELQRTVRDLERFNHLAVGREHRMIELKQEINDLLGSMGQEVKYETHSSENVMNKMRC